MSETPRINIRGVSCFLRLALGNKGTQTFWTEGSEGRGISLHLERIELETMIFLCFSHHLNDPI